MEVIWLDVPEFPTHEVSNEGVVRRKSDRKIMSTCSTLTSAKYGTSYVVLTFYVNKKSYKRYLHRVVASAFLPNPDNLPQVNHIDENKFNNNASNLEWCTAAHNIEHTHAKSYLLKSPDGEVVEVTNLAKFCRDNGLTQPLLSRVVLGRNNHHKGWTLCK